jgi:hypothetical protein
MSTFKKICLTLFVLLSATIATGKEFTIGLDPKFNLPGIDNDVAKRQISRAANEISKVANVDFRYSTQPTILVATEGFHPKYIGWWTGKRALLNTNCKYWNEDLVYMVATHEILHALKLEHDEDPLSMMKAKIDYTQRLGPTDVANLIRLYGIRKK